MKPLSLTMVAEATAVVDMEAVDTVADTVAVVTHIVKR
jgi:hypothetical protein